MTKRRTPKLANNAQHHAEAIKIFSRADGTPVYLPPRQTFEDTEATLVRDGLIAVKHHLDGSCDVFVPGPRHVRVLCWFLNNRNIQVAAGVELSVIGGEPQGHA